MLAQTTRTRCISRPVRSPAVPRGAGCRRRQRPRGGAESIRLRAIRQDAAQILADSPRSRGRAIPGCAVQFGLASAPRGRTGDASREFRTLHIHTGKSRRDRPEGPASRSANGLRHAGAIVLIRRRHLPVTAGFTACLPRRDVPAIGIIHAGPGSLMRTSGEGRAQGPVPFAAATADKRRQLARLENANGCTGLRTGPRTHLIPQRILCRCAPVETRGTGR